MIGRPPRSPLFPYPTLFRSKSGPASTAWRGTAGSSPPAAPASSGTREGAGNPRPRLRWRPRSTPSPTVRSGSRSEEHTSELQSPCNLVCRLLLEKKKQLPSYASTWVPVAGSSEHAQTSTNVTLVSTTSVASLATFDLCTSCTADERLACSYATPN